MIKITKSVFNPIGENTYVVYDDESLDAAVIDPGACSDKEKETLIKFIEDRKLRLQYVMETHGHLDHIMAHDDLCEKFGAKFAMSPLDLAEDALNQTMALQLGIQPVSFRKIDIPLKDGDKIDAGTLHFEVISTPGHSQGGLSFYMPSEKVVFTGDTLFKGSIGRTDFTTGSYPDLMKSIIKKILTLPMDIDVLPGHGDTTSLAQERDKNPFINEVIDGDVDASI